MIITRKSGLLLLLVAVAAAADGQTAGKPAAIRSVFVLPSGPQEGRDPFFPESIRPYESAVAKHPVVLDTTLTVRGFSGTPGNRMVIINNHTFAAGDEGDVITAGGRVHVRCLEITDDSVVVEVNDHTQKLKFSTE
jgi:hypothetical protein